MSIASPEYFRGQDMRRIGDLQAKQRRGALSLNEKADLQRLLKKYEGQPIQAIGGYVG